MKEAETETYFLVFIFHLLLIIGQTFIPRLLYPRFEDLTEPFEFFEEKVSSFTGLFPDIRRGEIFCLFEE